MYWAVSTFGPDWKLQPKVTVSQKCVASAGGDVSCSGVPKVEMALVSSPAVDLSDPEVLVVALSKATAVARTLRTTEGRVLDVSAAGEVLATAANVQASSAAYRQIFTGKDFYSSSTKLGLLANVESDSNLAMAQPWTGKQLPKLSETWVLTPRTANVLDPQMPFKVDARSKGLVRDRVNIETLETSVTFKVPSQR